MINLDILQAYSGDSFLLSFEAETKRYNVLIDSGIKNTYNHSLAERINEIPENEFIDLLIITHIDIDHIGGLLRYVEIETKETIESKIKEIWFNSGIAISKHFQEETSDREIDLNLKIENINGEIDTNYQHGFTLEKYLNKYLEFVWNKNLIYNKTTKLFENYKLLVISPDLTVLKELNENWQTEIDESSVDTANKKIDWYSDIEHLSKNRFSADLSIPNKSSIACLFQSKAEGNLRNIILLLADAHNPVVRNSLFELGFSKTNKLIVDMVKLSHHGSKCNLDYDLLEIIETNRFLISTSGKTGFPDKETLSKILCNPERRKDNEGKYIHKIEFIFNYPEENFKGLFSEENESKYNFTCIYNSQNKKWISISL